MLTSFSKLMNSSIEEEEEQDSEEGDEESNQDSDSDSDDENSRDPSQLTAEEDSQIVAPPPQQPLKSEKRKNIMSASPSSSSLGQGGRAGLMGAFGALFSSSAMANSRVQRRVNRNKPSPEEILKNKIKIEEQLNLGNQFQMLALLMYVRMNGCLCVQRGPSRRPERGGC